MIIKYNFLDCRYLCGRFPELADEINAENDWLGENLPHCLFGNILNPLVTGLLEQDGYKSDNLLKRTFAMYEDFAEYGDTETRNLLQVTLLEYLWDDYITYSRALEIMGKCTKDINRNIADYISVPEATYGYNTGKNQKS